MDHARVVRGFERRGDLPRPLNCLIDGNRSARESLGEVFALNQFHREEPYAVQFVRTVDPGDVRVIQRREQLRLALEARQPLRILGEGGGQDLDRHLAVERRVDRPPDDTHPALADLVDDAVVQQGLAGLDGHGGDFLFNEVGF